jgi:hypothetical protein
MLPIARELLKSDGNSYKQAGGDCDKMKYGKEVTIDIDTNEYTSYNLHTP